jgi:hypothetical protein
MKVEILRATGNKVYAEDLKMLLYFRRTRFRIRRSQTLGTIELEKNSKGPVGLTLTLGIAQCPERYNFT